MRDQPPTDPADHAAEFARGWSGVLDQYCAIRMQELGVPEGSIGASDFGGDRHWRAFIARDRLGGRITTGITINLGCLNPELLKGMTGSRAFAKARLRDRMDAVDAHEYEEDRAGSHEEALKSAPKTELPISEGARRILKAMARSAIA